MYFNWKKKTEQPIVLQSESESESDYSDESGSYTSSHSRVTSLGGAGDPPPPNRPTGLLSPASSTARIHGRTSSFTSGASALALPVMNGAVPLSASMRSARRSDGAAVPEQRLAQSYSGGRLMVSQGPMSARSNRSFGSYSQFLAHAAADYHPTMNILVIGAPQVGKSMLINAYRAAVTGNDKWPAAPVGICGFYGTTSVEPFPNHPTEPSWLCIDTPGRFYEGEAEVILEKLVEGMPWKSCLVGKKALTPAQVEDLTPIPANKAHQCIIAIPATDMIEDAGWTSVFQLKSRYCLASDAEGVVLYTKSLVSSLRILMEDACPFVVVTKMDKVGGCGNRAACQAVTTLLSQCVPTNRIFFSACDENGSTAGPQRGLVLDQRTRENLVQLHEDICFAVQWKKRVNDL